MASYISAVFEKARLVSLEQVRVIVQNRDDGDVPPQPSSSHFPTVPDDLRSFIVGQYINSTLGEEFTRIATLNDMSTVSPRELDYFHDNTATFVAAGVPVGALVYITVPAADEWHSNEYPGTNPFVFQIQAVINETTVQFTRPLPSFKRVLSWTIPALGLAGTQGVTLRNGDPAEGTLFRDTRFNRLFGTAVSAENAVIAMKADIQSLVNEDVGESLVTEIVTIGTNV